MTIRLILKGLSFDKMTVYLDNAATTKPIQSAVDALLGCVTENYGNASSLHKLGIEAEKSVTLARKSISEILGVPYECVYFTSGATESNNMAVCGVADALKRRGKKIVSTAIEHPSVENSLKSLEAKGFEVVRIAPRGGEIKASDIVSAVDKDTILVSVMLVNNENGSIQPVSDAFTAIKRLYPQTVTHCDAVQAFCKIPLKANSLNADIISISGHKIHGIKGVGALYIKKGTRINPIIFGGGQEKGMRSGTESVPLIAAFGAAAREGAESLVSNYRRAVEISEYAAEKLKAAENIRFNLPKNRSPYIMNISVPGIRSEIMLHFLEEKGIMVSSGSACSKGAKSGVLSLFGCTPEEVDSALRISISAYTRKDEIDYFTDALKEAQRTLCR